MKQQHKLKAWVQQETQKNRKLLEKYEQRMEEMHKVCKVLFLTDENIIL